MPRIAIVHYAGPPGIGGVESTIAAHTRALAANGHQVRWLVGQGAADGVVDELAVLPLLGSRGAGIEALNAELARGRVPAQFATLVRTIADQLRTHLDSCDVLIVHNALTLHKNLALTAALRELLGAGALPATVLAWCHDLAWNDPLYAAALHPGYPWDLLRTAWPGVRYVSVSADRQSQLAALLDLPPEQITTVWPGVDLGGLLNLGPEALDLLGRFDLLAGDPLLLLPARLTRRKNIEAAIGIVAALCDAGARPRLVITGPPGPHNPANAAYLDGLNALIAQRRLEDAVIVLHQRWLDSDGAPRRVSDAAVADLYRLADGLLLTSRSEGFGMPVLEAGLVGLPIFCSDLPSLRAIAGDAATYFDPDGDPRRIAAALLSRLGGDPRSRLRAEIRRRWTWEAIFDRHIEPLLPTPLEGGSYVHQ
jgi:mannosylglucosylglycerate synthase